MNSRLASDLDQAVSAWIGVLGRENVILEPAALREAETATFPTSVRVPVILRPTNVAEVQEVVRIASRYRVPLYPISSGFNWGYGSRVPVGDGCALVDLRRMKRILDFSEESAYVTVEPGVTQAELYEFLQQRGSKLWLDATGSTPESSLIGNTMERGFGHTPYGDHFATSCAVQAVLADGTVVDTGFARFPNARSAPVYRWGIGPSIDGLFSQSNLGIVTRMTIWLMPAPEYFQAYFFKVEQDENLESLIDVLRPLRLNGTIRSAAHIGNDYKVLSALRQYPWEETKGQTPLLPETMKRFRKSMNFGAWNGSGGLYGTKTQVAEARRLLRAALKGKVSKLQFLDDRLLDLAGRFAKPFGMVAGWDLSRTLELVKPVYGLMKGVPTNHPLASTYWRKRTPPPPNPDPDRDGCGLLWCAPTAPIRGKEARELATIATETLLGHGFEPMMSITLITERALTCVITIAYDRTGPSQDEQAMLCYRELLRKLWSAGFYSYRLGIQSMEEMSGENGFNRLLGAIRGAVDPQGILAPGRYQGLGGVRK